VKWSSLEGTESISSCLANEPASNIPDAVLKQDKAPAYPTSSRNGPKNWETIVEDEKDEDEGVDDFFKKLYKGSDEDTRRAMMKSMQESGGTSLSTSWDDVKSKTFKPIPPDGMEAKEY